MAHLRQDWRHSRAITWVLTTAFGTGLAFQAGASEASSREIPITEPAPRTPLEDPPLPITPGWIATQLIPSVGVSVASGNAQFHMSWQVTPLAYGWNLQRGLSPWRVLIVEPSVRQGGSIETFVAPQYFGVGDTFESKWGVRGGIRSTFPLYARGEYLSLSVGSGVTHHQSHTAPSYEVGLHVLFGTLGLVGVVNPGLPTGELTVLLRWRYF